MSILSLRIWLGSLFQRKVAIYSNDEIGQFTEISIFGAENDLSLHLFIFMKGTDEVGS